MKHIFLRVVLAVSMTLYTGLGFANGIAALQAFVAQTRSASGEFTQRRINTPRRKPSDNQLSAPRMGNVISSGTFAFARPGKFIWTYRKPYRQVLVTDGKTFYLYDQDLNQVTERKLDNALESSPAAILFGRNDLTAHYTLRDKGIQQGIDWLELMPKNKNSQFQQIRIGFGTGKEEGELKAMKLQDLFGNVTELTFSHLRKNPALPANTFHFTVPPGADVIKE